MSNRPPTEVNFFRRPNTTGGSRPYNIGGPRRTFSDTIPVAPGSDLSGEAGRAIATFSLARKNLVGGMSLFKIAEKALIKEPEKLRAIRLLYDLGDPLHEILGAAIRNMSFEIYGWGGFMKDIESFCSNYRKVAGNAVDLSKPISEENKQMGLTEEFRDLKWEHNTIRDLFRHMPEGMGMMGKPLGPFFRGYYRVRLSKAELMVMQVSHK